MSESTLPPKCNVVQGCPKSGHPRVRVHFRQSVIQKKWTPEKQYGCPLFWATLYNNKRYKHTSLLLSIESGE